MSEKTFHQGLENQLISTIKNLGAAHLSQINLIEKRKESLQKTYQIKIDKTSEQKLNFNKIQLEFSSISQNDFLSWNQNCVALTQDNSIIIELCESNLDDFKATKKSQNSKNFTSKQAASTQKSKNLQANADLACCYLIFHNFELHQKRKFDNLEQKIFDEFEKIRLIANAFEIYLGVAKNLLQKLDYDLGTIVDFQQNQAIALFLIPEFISKTELSQLKNLDKFLKNLSQKIPQKILTKIKQISHHFQDQEGFAIAVEELLEMIRTPEISDSKNQSKSGDNSSNQNQDVSSFGAENIDQEVDEKSESPEIDEKPKKSEFLEENAIEPAFIKSREEQDSTALDESYQYEEKISFKEPYKIFSSNFDEVIFPQKFIKKSELQILRDQLDLKLMKLSSISNKMSLKLKKKLLSKRNNSQKSSNSVGILNRKMLSRFIIKANDEEIWQEFQPQEFQNTAISILIDNSGSMRGNPIVMSAMACEIIAEILEKFSIKTEIIGFTTADWRGGRVRKNWEINGKPQNPGRLNELRHIIYKHFNQNFKRSKINLGLMLKEGILKENIDGEALLFAKGRLLQQSAKRKILMVISDGNPVDDSTNSSNQGDILNEHLRHVIAKIEKQSAIELIGVGIGHSTSDFYRNSISIKNLEDLGDAMIQKIIEIL